MCGARIIRETHNTWGIRQLLLRVQAAKEELARANETRKRNAAHPVLEGSPTTYGWKVEERAQSLAIRQGLEDAVNSTIFDPHQVHSF